MAKETALTKAELTALAAADGTPAQPKMLPEIKARLIGLYLIERREWPNGPLWRTPKGDHRMPARK
jgi:hypothetical protein